MCSLDGDYGTGSSLSSSHCSVSIMGVDSDMWRAEYGAAAHYMYKEAGPAADAQSATARVSERLQHCGAVVSTVGPSK